MDLLVLLSVLAITQTIVLARPADTHPKTKRSTDECNKIFKPSRLNFPTALENGFTVIINGTLDTKSETFEVVFPSRSRAEEDNCRIIFDFKNNMLDISPKHPDWKTEPYELSAKEEHPTFSIRLTASTMTNEKHLFKLHFEGNKGGDSSAMTCDITKFDDFEGVEFKSGLNSITSFFVKF